MGCEGYSGKSHFILTILVGESMKSLPRSLQVSYEDLPLCLSDNSHLPVDNIYIKANNLYLSWRLNDREIEVPLCGMIL